MRASLTAATAALCLPLAACGVFDDTTVDGAVGLSRTDSGSLVVLVDTCEEQVDEILVSEGRELLTDEAQTNRTIGRLRAGAATSGRLRVPAVGDAQWRAVEPVLMPEDPRRLVIVVAHTTDNSVETRQVSARVEQVTALRPGQVVRGDGEVVTEDEFHRGACS